MESRFSGKAALNWHTAQGEGIGRNSFGKEVPKVLHICCTWRNVKGWAARGPARSLACYSSSTGGGTRTHTTLRPLDFESSASANSATPAKVVLLHVPKLLGNSNFLGRWKLPNWFWDRLLVK